MSSSEINRQFIIYYSDGTTMDVSPTISQFSIVKYNDDFTPIYDIYLTLPVSIVQTTKFYQNISKIYCRLPLYNTDGSLYNIVYRNIFPINIETSIPTREPSSGLTSTSLEQQFVKISCRSLDALQLYNFTSFSKSGNPITIIKSLLPQNIGYISPPQNVTGTYTVPNQRLTDAIYYLLDRGCYASDYTFIYDRDSTQNKLSDYIFIYSIDDSVNHVAKTVYFWNTKPIQPTTDNVIAKNVVPVYSQLGLAATMPQTMQQNTYTNTSLYQTTNVNLNMPPNLGNATKSNVTPASIASTNALRSSNFLSQAFSRGVTLQLYFDYFPQLVDLRPGQCITFNTDNLQYKQYNGKYIIKDITFTVDLDKKNYNYSVIYAKSFGF
ncbi:MAG: hypothetical protein QXI16_04440 [Sulfolobaceae archaeon]